MTLSELIEKLTEVLNQGIDSDVLVIDPHNVDHYDILDVEQRSGQVAIMVELQ